MLWIFLSFFGNSQGSHDSTALSSVEFLISGISVIQADIITVTYSLQSFFFFLVQIHNIDIPYPKIIIYKDDTTSKHHKKKSARKKEGDSIARGWGWAGGRSLNWQMASSPSAWNVGLSVRLWHVTHRPARSQIGVWDVGLCLLCHLAVSTGESDAQQHCWSPRKKEQARPRHMGPPWEGEPHGRKLRSTFPGWERKCSLAETRPFSWMWPRIN